MKPLVLRSPKAFCFTVHRARAKLCWHELLHTIRIVDSFASAVQNLCKSILVKVVEWCVNCSSWLGAFLSSFICVLITVDCSEHAPSIIFMDEIDSIGSSRMDSGGGGDSEVQRTMLELLNQLDGFEATKNIKVSVYQITATAVF